MVEVSTVFHRHQLPHQANFRAWGRYTATHRGGAKYERTPQLYALSAAALAPTATSAPVRFAASLVFTMSTQPVPSDNLLMMSKDRAIRGAGLIGGAYGAYLLGRGALAWYHDVVRHHAMKVHNPQTERIQSRGSSRSKPSPSGRKRPSAQTRSPIRTGKSRNRCRTRYRGKRCRLPAKHGGRHSYS